MSSFLPSAAIKNYRADIDGLRAVAILLVLWFHAFPDAMPGGFIGVDVFFVISGFLITGIVLRGIESGRFSFAHFYAQRARRLLPALMVVLPATLVAGWHWLWPQEYEQLASHTVAAAAFVLNFVLWTEAGYFDVATELKPLMHLWSLGIEEQFYLVYPGLLWLTWRLWRQPVLAISVLIIVSFAANVIWLQFDRSGAFFLPQTRFWELALGGLVSWFNHTHRRNQSETAPLTRSVPRAAREVLPWLGLVAIGTAAAILKPGMPYPGFAALLPVAGSLALLTAGPDTWVNRHVLGNRVMVLIGLISYTLYLWHWPILSFLRITHAGSPPFLLRCGAVLLSFVLAWLTYRYIETPIRFGGQRKLRLAGVVTAVCATALAGWGIRMMAGVPDRLPAEISALLAYQYDYRNGYQEGTCFLRPEQNAAAYANCTDTWSETGPNWLLWGDSHAAHLRPAALAAALGATTFVQRAASGCPPLAGESFPDRPHCPDIQSYVWQEIEKHRPHKVTLAARWDFYDWQKLSDTIDRLRALGVQQIELVGPVPQWHNGLPRQAAIAYRQNGYAKIPHRLTQGLNAAPFEIDRQMAEFAEAHGVAYVSPIQILCNEKGCLVISSEKGQLLTAWDDAHLTQEGSGLIGTAWRPRQTP